MNLQTNIDSLESLKTTQRVSFQDGDDNLADSSFDKPGENIPRPLLTLKQAAFLLGKSLRALERSLLGRWGNKLPEGWTARKIPTDEGFEWRVIPPLGYSLPGDPASTDETKEFCVDEPNMAIDDERAKSSKPGKSFALKKRVIKEATIVIDRSDEVELLLKELLQTQKQLSEERRLRVEDMRLITQMQGSMRLLEDRANETRKLKEELTVTRKEFDELKEQYLTLLRLPWWKRLFLSKPK